MVSTNSSSEDEDDLRGSIQNTVYVYLLATVITIGIICNILNIFIFSQTTMKSNVYLYLRAMSVSDMLALIFDITYAANLYARRPKSTMAEAVYGAHIEFFLKQSCNASSVLLIIVTTIERYISLCHPHKAPYICTRKRTLILIGCSVTLAILFNIPRIWERTIVETMDPVTSKAKYLDKALSEYSTSSYYTFHKYLYISLFMFLPLITLAILNTRIIIALRYYSKKKQQMTSHQVFQKKEQKRTTTALVVVVMAFLILIIPSAIAYLLQDDDSFTAFVFVCIADLMGEMNLAINFFIYMVFNKTFREVFMDVFKCKKETANQGIGLAVVREPSSVIGNDLETITTQTTRLKSNKVHPAPGSTSQHI